MRCPSCGMRVPDGSLSCPWCHADLGLTQKISLGAASWCPICGALVAPGAETCPKCGSALPREPAARATRDLDLPQIGNTSEMRALTDDAGETGVITRIESAIPAGDADSSPAARHDRMPRTRVFLFAALAAVVVVGGATLLITHPWDPDATQTKATTPADTSQSGFPGFLDLLSGQDRSEEASSSDASDAASTTDTDEVFSAISAAYESLGDLSARVDANEESLRSDGVSADADARSSGQADAADLSIEVSNLISQIQSLDDGAGAYTSTIDNLETLGNWLRNRCDALGRSWSISVASADPVSDREKILAPAEAAQSYATLFSQSYASWEPQSS